MGFSQCIHGGIVRLVSFKRRSIDRIFSERARSSFVRSSGEKKMETYDSYEEVAHRTPVARASRKRPIDPAKRRSRHYLVAGTMRQTPTTIRPSAPISCD